MSNKYSNNSWLEERFNRPDAYLWYKARKMMLLSKPTTSALDLVDMDTEKLYSNSNQIEETNRPETCLRWTENTDNSVRTLIDFIVTRWKPEYLNKQRLNVRELHRNLVSTPWDNITTTFDDDIYPFDAEEALKTYQNRLIPLHYHELWSSVTSEFKDVEHESQEHTANIEVQQIKTLTTLDKTEQTGILVGTYRSILDDPFAVLNKRLVLFDFVLLTIGQERYFGVVIHAKIVEIASSISNTQTASNNNFSINLMTTIGVYVSHKCVNAFEQQKITTKSKTLEIIKITNIGSTRSMINATYNLKNWAQYPSLIKPTIDDPYFELPEQFDSTRIKSTDGFNWTQSKVVDIAEHIFEDLHEHLHMVHGPPGTGKSRTIAKIVSKLLPKLKRDQKILLCAPSNKACDELLRRIVDEFDANDTPCSPGTIIRVGCQPANEYELSEYFLDFMVLEDLVKMLRIRWEVPNQEAQKVEKRIFDNGKIIISTLNYCGSFRMRRLMKKVGFIIVDEASQSLEADTLIPLRFNCRKLMLVGDPNQLSPTVQSDVGREYDLNLSLYRRLYSIFKQYKNGTVTMLSTQYRMHSAICQFPSEFFYENRLKTHYSVDEDMEHFPLQPIVFYDMTQSKHCLDHGRSSFNIGEVSFIQRFCTMLATDTTVWNSLVAEDSLLNTTPILLNDDRSITIQQHIAVITPYQAQSQYIRERIPQHIEVMTADSSQGSEKDIIIISCVRSHDHIGFLNDRSRLNVMLTRAKYGLYVVGNLTWLAQQDTCWRALVDNAHKRGILRSLGNVMPNLPKL